MKKIAIKINFTFIERRFNLVKYEGRVLRVEGFLDRGLDDHKNSIRILIFNYDIEELFSSSRFKFSLVLYIMI